MIDCQLCGGRHADDAVPCPEVRTGEQLGAKYTIGPMIGLGGIADHTWLQLSEGERQRTLLARAQMAHPRLLILDEPCAGLDPVAREAFLASLSQFARAPRGPGLVLVTHHVEEIVAGFTHALLLRKGTALDAGPLAKTLTSAKLSGLFGHPVRVRREGPRWRLQVTASE